MKNLDYGLIGNCQSAALISRNGSIDWCCLPRFDSPSVFAKLLDTEKGGSLSFALAEDYEIDQHYIWSTNVLRTRFTNGNDAFEVIDFMPRYKKQDGNFYTPPDVVRFIRYIYGAPKFIINHDPKLEYASQPVESTIKGDFIYTRTTGQVYDSLYLYSSFALQDIKEGNEITLKGDAFVLVSYHEKLAPQNLNRTYLKFQRTKTYWMEWSENTRSYKEYNEEIMRSALILKALSYEQSGAVLAAATTSLPETIGEVRNWDYRFCWIRDASMVIRVMSHLGHAISARKFLDFVVSIIPDKDEKIQIMYGINGERDLTEKFLDHLSGYEGSSPVRIGNAAYIQKQNDIYGILLEVIYRQFVTFETSLDNKEELWTIAKGISKIVEEHWQEPDKGIWELRTEDRHFTFSKLLCWVAIDRTIKIGEILGLDHRLTDLKQLRTQIHEDIYLNSWNEEVQAYTQYYGSKDLDASTLLMEQYGFIEATDERYIKTVQATERELCKDGLMYRYKNEDDFGLPSSSFTICSFWFINSLNKIGESERARKYFDQLLSYSNHLGLFSEDIDFETKRLLGNFPQAYSHLALIETAVNFNRDGIKF
jgi:GH15 family glucan-1,4-alpha-glucosidase